MEFTEKILQIMNERGISAYEICKNLNISNTTFSSWKKGSKPSIDKAVEILRYLQLSADEIFGLESIELTEHEKQLLNNYRTATPGIQNAINKLLDINDQKERLSDSRTG